MIISNYSDFNFDNEKTPLISACQKGHYEIANFLLSKGVSVNDIGSDN